MENSEMQTTTPTATAPSFNITVDERESIFTKITFHEKVDTDLLRRIIASKELKERHTAPSKKIHSYYPQNQAESGSIQYDIEKMGLMKLLKKAKNGYIPVNYSFGTGLKSGRVYAKDSCSLGNIIKDVRHTLCRDMYYDVDIVCCHPTLMIQICDKQQIPIKCNIIKEYIENRDRILLEHSEKYGVERDDAKQLFNILTFGGSFETWRKDLNLNEEFEPTPFSLSYQNQMTKIASIFYNANPKIAKELKKEKYKAMYSITHYLLGEYERQILETAYEFVVEKCINGDKNVFVGCYDGFQILKENWKPEYLNLLEERVNEKNGFNIKYIIKEMNSGFVGVHTERDEKSKFFDYKKYEDIFEKYCNERGTIRYLSETHAGHFIFDGYSWFCWDQSENSSWKQLSGGITIAVLDEMSLFINDFINEINGFLVLESKGTDNYKIIEALLIKFKNFKLNSLTSSTFVRHVIELGETYFLNKDIDFDMNQNLIGFPIKEGNGFIVYDIEKAEFRPAIYTDYITMKCNVNYNDIIEDNTSNIKAVYKLLDRIQPDPEVRDLLLTIFSSGLSGRAYEKFIILNGAGRNGKGMLDDFIVSIFGNYAIDVSSSIITEKTQSSGSANPEIAKISKKRYIVMREPDKQVPINNSAMRDLTGGGKLSARALYSDKTEVYLHNTTILEANAKPIFKSDPEVADYERVIDINFPSRFTDKADEVDESIGWYFADSIYKTEEWRKEHGPAMMVILLQQLQKLKKETYRLNAFVPEQVKQRTNEYMMKSFDVYNCFISMYKLNENSTEKPTIARVASNIRANPDFKLLPKLKQRELTSEYVKNFILTNKFFKKYIVNDKHTKQTVLVGWEEKIEDEED
jgi:phage/plasmid-associated DNA primase